MKKIIYNKEYNTETATIIKKATYGHYGDPNGYEETLYQTPEGLYFIFVNGGASSSYPTADIIRLAKSKVSAWLNNH